MYQCKVSRYYDIRDTADFTLANTADALKYQVYPMCLEPNIETGLNKPSFSNNSAEDLLIKTNPYGFYLEISNNELNGIPKKVGDYGIRMAYEHSDGSGIAHYSFLRVTSKGENAGIVLYLKPSIVDKYFLFQLEDD